jgi:beta-N-acetylhexosaminidase
MILEEKLQEFLRKSPFNLGDEGIEWVGKTIQGMSLREKISQLINIQILPGDDQAIELINKHQPGAVTVINFSDPQACKKVIQKVALGARLPPLICADIEGGVTSGHLTTNFPNQLGCAAANCLDTYGEALKALSAELVSLGVNWTFSPVLDINHAFQSAVVGTRSYGSDQQRIAEMSALHIQALQAQGVAATAKHWPGEGYDDRDQHLVTTINPLSVDQWVARFGALYTRAIEAGVLSVMSAHIAFPAYARSEGVAGIEACRPASISSLLNQSLLRGQLKFNGLIISDATLMGGLESWGRRKQWLPEVIQNGCDMILFSNTLDDDVETLIEAVDSGTLTTARLEDALIRVLGLKAKLSLHRQPASSELPGAQMDWAEHKSIMARLSSLSPTLIKDVQKTLPLSRTRIRKILMFKEENTNPLGGGEEFRLQLDQLLAAEGFEVKVFDPAIDKLDDHVRSDLIIYAIAQESQLTKSRIFLDWAKLHGGPLPAMARFWWDKPTILISFGHPYYLYDAPRMPCLINAYTPTIDVQKAVLEKLMGRSDFTGNSPVDAFCGLTDAHY